MISLIATVYNEKDNLEKWLDDLLHQSKLPDEIVIVDGGSNDGTWERLVGKAGEYKIFKVFQRRGNISSGRNFAIKNAAGDLIVATDAGCVYDKNWFDKISAPLLAGKKFAATAFGPLLNEKDSIILYLIAACTTPAPREFLRNWLPSSRSVAFAKDVWEKAGGYPEWIPICEDIIFDLKVKRAGVETEYVREPLVFWRPRKTLSAYFKQLYKYTQSDGHGKLWLNRQMIRYVVYAASLVLLILALTENGKFAIVLVAGLALYMNKLWQRWFVFAKKLSAVKIISGFILLPLFVVFGDLAKMCGWPIGVWERRTGKIKFEKY